MAQISQISKTLAVDAEILVGLHLEIPPHVRAYEFFCSKGYQPFVPPAVWAILQDTALHGPASDAGRAQQIIEEAPALLEVPDLDSVYQEVLDIHADFLTESGVLPGITKIDAIGLLEAAYLGADTFLTVNRIIRTADKDKLTLVLIDGCGLAGIDIKSPGMVTEFLDEKAGLQAGSASLGSESESV